MRIWSKSLINVLPNKQLQAMRYELGDMIKQYPNIKHPLVNFANNYDIGYLYYYFMLTCLELKNRHINMQESYNHEMFIIFQRKTKLKSLTPVSFDEDNDEYLTICYWNLYEKHLRGMITDEEWFRIENICKNI